MLFLRITYLLFFSLFHLLDAADAKKGTIIFTMEHPDRSITRLWSRHDFAQLRGLVQMFEDLGTLEDPSQAEQKHIKIPLKQEHHHITHRYLKNLIKGNFIDYGINQCINDYSFFIGEDIQIPHNPAYEPLSSSLKWKIFKDNKDFFRINMQFGRKSIKDKLQNFLSPGLIQAGLGQQKIFKIEWSNLTIRKEMPFFKLSLRSPFLIDYAMFSLIDENERNKVTWLDLSNTILFDLNLPMLLKYFPQLNKLSVQNSLISEIRKDDFELLIALRDKYLDPTDTANTIANFRELEIVRNTYQPNRPADMQGISKLKEWAKEVRKIEDYVHETIYHSFIIDLRGCSINNANDFLNLKNHQINIPYKKSLLILGIPPVNINLRARIRKIIVHKKELIINVVLSTLLLTLLAPFLLLINVIVSDSMWKITIPLSIFMCIGTIHILDKDVRELYKEVYPEIYSFDDSGACFKK